MAGQIEKKEAKLDALESSGSSSEPSEEAVEQKVNDIAKVEKDLNRLKDEKVALQGQLAELYRMHNAGKSCCSISNASLLPK